MAGHRNRDDEERRRRREKKKKGLPTGKGADLASGADMIETEFEIRAEILKNQTFDEGLVLGWVIVCSEMGEEYFDLQGDAITEKAMLSAATDFAENCRVAKVMHQGEQTGVVVHTWPLTSDIAKAFGIQCDKRGLMIAMKPYEAMLEKFKSGELNGFSIGGLRGEDEEIDE